MKPTPQYIEMRSRASRAPAVIAAPIDAQHASGERGTFALKPSGVMQSAHLHQASCTKLDPSPKYPLKSLINGISETSTDVPMATPIAAHLALNVHESANALPDYVACGTITP